MGHKAALSIVVAFACGCSATTDVGTTSQAVVSANGLFQNGLSTNGVYQNGVYQNGVYQNGLWLSGLWSNPVWQVGSNATALRTNPYTRQFFQYVYACAMPGSFDPSIGPPTDPDAQLPPGRYSTSLDPNNGALACNAAGLCDDPFYTCDSATNRCVVQLDGAVGVGVNADGTTWWNSGTCDQSCQRWVSACVLARTNAYGVHVDISLHAPDDAPQTIKNALYTSPAERSAYALREGAYYGNVFATTQVTSGPFTGALVATPSFYACAGPGSNIPEITKRFCSSQGDQAVIAVPGVCLPTGPEKPVCTGEDTDPSSPTFGAIHDCYTSTDWTGLTPISEVITVYLRQPISVCGNAVCEANEADASSPAYCPSDCHVGSWARSISVPIDQWYGLRDHLAVDPADGSVYVVSGLYGDFTITFDDTPSPAVVMNGDPTNNNDALVVAKYAADGTLQWSHRYIEPSFSSFGGSTAAITVAPDHGLVLVGVADAVWLAKIAADGTLASAPITIGTPGPGTSLESDVVRIDASGNLVVVGELYNGSPLPTVTFGSTTKTGGSTDVNIFVAKLSPSGQPIWLNAINADPTQSRLIARSMTIDGAGDVYVAGYDNQSSARPTVLFKFDATTGANAWGLRSGLNSLEFVTSDPRDASHAVYVGGGGGLFAKLTSDGTIAWQRSIGFVSDITAAAIDPSGNVVMITDYIWPIDFGAGVFNPYAVNHDAVVAYSPSGTFVWAKHIPTILGATTPYAQVQTFPEVEVDPRGRVIVSGGFAGSVQVDDRLLVTQVPELKQGDAFVGSFFEPSPNDTSIIIGDAIDALGAHVATTPRTITVEATSPSGAFVFFMPPTALDDGGAGTNVTCSPAPNTTFPIGTTPVTCTAKNALGYSSTATFDVVVRDSLAPAMANVPSDIASSSSVVPFALPTAVDQVDGAVPVTCVPASGSTFAVGTTTVQCTATDRHGNSVQASFAVTVNAPADSTPPTITVPPAMTVPAVNAAGAVVTYDASATDNTAVASFACAPQSGAQLPLGTTTVRCTATDTAGNTSSASFTVTVADQTPPVVSVPAAIAVEATGPAGATVTYAASAADNVDGAVTPQCAPASGSTFPVGTTVVPCTARDAAGNASTVSFTVTVTDTTPPVLTLPATIVVNATSVGGSVVTYAASATDGVDGAVATSCSPASGALFATGATTVSCSATDAHGNRATGSFVVDVVFSWSGVLQPINPDGSSIFRLGSTVPVKFQLTGPSAGITNLVATLLVSKVSSHVTGDYVEATSNGSADSGNTFRYDASSGIYIFNLSTQGLSVGTWSLQIVMPDGVSRTVNISLR